MVSWEVRYPGEDSWKFLVRLCRRFSKSRRKCHSSHLFSYLASKVDIRFQTWPLRYDVIITYNANKKDFLKATSNSHIYLSFLFIWN